MHIPALDDPFYTVNGRQQRNPLNTGYLYDSAQGGLTGQLTERQWGQLDAAYLAEYAYRALTRNSFADFQRELEAVHATVHNQIGGTMVPVKTAAFDPIFWFHHAFVNIIWSMWVSLHPQADMGGVDDVVVDNYDLSGSRTRIRTAMQRNVAFPHNRLYRRAAQAVRGGGGGLQFMAMEDESAGDDDWYREHLILTVHNVTSPMDSSRVLVTFEGKTAGYMGMLGMAHRATMTPGHAMACYDRIVDLTIGYHTHIGGRDLHQVKHCMEVRMENLNTGDLVTFTEDQYDLQWETY